MNRGYVTTDDAAVDGHIYTIAPQIAGRVAEVLVDDNQHVTKGQVLVLLDDRDQQMAVLKAQAELAQAEAAMAQAGAQQQEADASLTQAEQDYKRFTSVAPGATSSQQVDAAAAAARSAEAKDAAAIAGASMMQAQLLAAKAELQNAELQLSYISIAAPASGHVAMKSVQLGNVVTPGTAMMAVVGDDVWVTANFKETQLAGITPGASATIQVDAVPGVTFKAKVDSIQYGTGAVFSLLPAQNATGNYIKVIQRVPVKLVFKDARVKNYQLAPGMSVEPSIRLSP
jgi:membrane fusion protein (multidrug efflux system)